MYIYYIEFCFFFFRNKTESKDHINDNSSEVAEMSEVEIEFTPDLKWKRKTRSKEINISSVNRENSTIKSIATPVIKSLKSVLEADRLI